MHGARAIKQRLRKHAKEQHTHAVAEVSANSSTKGVKARHILEIVVPSVGVGGCEASDNRRLRVGSTDRD